MRPRKWDACYFHTSTLVMAGHLPNALPPGEQLDRLGPYADQPVDRERIATMLGKVEEFPNGVTVHQTTDEPQRRQQHLLRSLLLLAGFRLLRLRPGIFGRANISGRNSSPVSSAHGTNTSSVRAYAEAARLWPTGASSTTCGLIPVANLHWCGSIWSLGGNALSLCRAKQRRGAYRRSHQAIATWRIWRSRSYSPQAFVINLVDLQTGSIEAPSRGSVRLQPLISSSSRLTVGFSWSSTIAAVSLLPTALRRKLVGDQGATLFFLEIPSGRVIRPELGPPYTHSISGHETWIGDTGELILTLNVQQDYDHGRGALLGVRPEGPIRTICVPYEANHIGLDSHGRLFAAESFEPDQIVAGCPQTHRTTPVCPARTRYVRRHASPEYLADHHPHPYVSPGPQMGDLQLRSHRHPTGLRRPPQRRHHRRPDENRLIDAYNSLKMNSAIPLQRSPKRYR